MGPVQLWTGARTPTEYSEPTVLNRVVESESTSRGPWAMDRKGARDSFTFPFRRDPMVQVGGVPGLPIDVSLNVSHTAVLTSIGTVGTISRM